MKKKTKKTIEVSGYFYVTDTSKINKADVVEGVEHLKTTLKSAIDGAVGDLEWDCSATVYKVEIVATPIKRVVNKVTTEDLA